MIAAGSPAPIDDERLLHQALTEGGISIETRDPAGVILFRTVIQIDGDVLNWIRRTPRQQDGTGAGAAADAATDSIDLARADEHFAAVVASADALEAALERLSHRARRWMKRARAAGFASSAISAAAGVGGASPVFWIAGAASSVVGLAAARWASAPIGRYVLRRVGRWLGARNG